MGKEAKEHGFRISSHPALLATKPLAYFERTRNGKNQMFEITEYRIFPGEIFLRGASSNDITLEYHNEEEFEKCIHLFHEHMMKEGYDLLDKVSEIKEFERVDGIYIKENYRLLAEKFVKENAIDCNDGFDWNNFLSLVCCYIEQTYDLEWNVAKPKLSMLAGYITDVLIKQIDASIENDGDKFIYFNVERISDGVRKIVSPLKIVYVSYRHKDADKILVDFIKDFIGN